MKDDKFYLYTLIALLLGIICFWLIAPALESGFIQYISFGTIIISLSIFVSKGYNMLKDKKSNQKFDKEVRKIVSNLPKISFDNTDKINPFKAGVNEKICTGVSYEKFTLAKVSKISSLWKKELNLEYVVIETFCNELLNELEDSQLKEELRRFDCKVYTFPDGWDNMTTTVALETKLIKIREVYDVLLSFGFYMGTIKDRRTNANIYLTVYDNKVEYMVSHRYLNDPFDFDAKIKRILNGK
ncbi:MAG: hypothetical protein Q7I99_06090 [Acholeplasmataceae bacterium]|nr:hypothetical protein [Acholeplasmataceae bacterium]